MDRAEIERLRESNAKLVDALIVALPYVEDAEVDPGYKRDSVRKALAVVKAAITNAEG